MKHLPRALELYRRGDNDGALASCLQALQQPAPPAATYALAGELLLRRREWPRAEALLRRATALTPQDAAVRFNLGAALAQQGQSGAALLEFERCLHHDARNPDFLNAAGNCLRLLGRTDEARPLLERGLSIAPRHPGLHENLGWLELEKIPARARTHFDAAAAAGNRSPGVARGLAEALLGMGQPQKAEQLLRSALHVFPRSAELHHCLGVALVRQNRTAEAAAAYRRALEIDPSHAAARTNLAVQLEYLGLLDEAERELRETLHRHPHQPDALFHLAFLKSADLAAADAQSLRDALADDGLAELARYRLHLALGRVQDQLGEPREAMETVLAGRRIAARTSVYDPARDSAQGAQLVASHPAELVRTGGAPAASETTLPTVVFIVGMPRSGTSLAEQVLASHPATCALGETGIATSIEATLRESCGGEYPVDWGALPDGLLPALRRQLREQLRSRAEAALNGDTTAADRERTSEKVIVETSPANHALVGMLAVLLPEARFVLCERAPLDTCVSILQHPLSARHDYAHRLDHLAHRVREFDRLQAHWLTALPGRCQRLTYEALVTHPEPTIRALLAGLDLSFDRTCLSPHLTERAVRTPSAAQVRAPMSTSACGRWRKYREPLAPLLQALEASEAVYQARLAKVAPRLDVTPD
ncbi:sulfotransferase [Microbulbifer salipaludis]|uniref:Sulfotransferase n=1 Tax=Microbulbifer salipaludis TaxID=187980 RepID=A0ABS3E7Z7_9GAMM|nr:tetratricopeptide repeat-containing sulfotransferase family protein [Microbulbifer salipaludis]MBN8431323.1 sulfotransferase [Microbulbifer salipaludis]